MLSKIARRPFRWYVESLDQSLKELEKEKEEPPLPLAATTVEGINIPEAFEIMRKGVKEANEINRKKLLDMMKEASDAADRSKFMVYLGSACIILGAVMHLFLWFLSPGGEH
jgi:hypothetical protein